MLSPQKSLRMSLKPPRKNFVSAGTVEPDYIVLNSYTPLSMALDYNSSESTCRTNYEVIEFLLSKSKNVLLIPDSNQTIALHKFLRGRYFAAEFSSLLSQFLDMYACHAYAAAFIRDAHEEIPLQVMYTQGHEKFLIEQVGRFTSESIEKCMSMVENTKLKPPVQLQESNISQNYFVMLPDPMRAPPPEVDGMFSASGFVFYYAADGTFSRVMGLISNYLVQEFPDTTGNPREFLRCPSVYRKMAMRTLNVNAAEKMMEDVAVYVSAKTYKNFDGILEKLRGRNAAWFKEYNVLIRKDRSRLLGLQSDWTALQKAESTCFFAPRLPFEPVPSVSGKANSRSEEDATRNANELLASLEAEDKREQNDLASAKSSASQKKERRRMAKQLIEDNENVLRAEAEFRKTMERNLQRKAVRQEQAALELAAQRKMMEDHEAKNEAAALQKAAVKARAAYEREAAAAEELQEKRTAEARALVELREKQIADERAVQVLRDECIAEAKVHKHVFGILMDDLEEALLQQQAMEAVTRPGINSGLIQHLIPQQQLEEEIRQLRALAETLRENRECVICFSEVRNVLLRPCGHACLCSSCWTGSNKPQNCPVCRAPIVSGEIIFME